MKKASRKLSKPSKIVQELTVPGAHQINDNLKLCVSDFLSYPSVERLRMVVSSSLRYSADRILCPQEEEIEFLKSVWSDILRFEILAKLSEITDSTIFTTTEAGKELAALFISPSTSPWCIYCTIFGLSCSSCPFFLMTDPPLKVNIFTKRSMCWAAKGFWAPLAKTLVEQPSTYERLKTMFLVYSDTVVPVKMVAAALNKGA